MPFEHQYRRLERIWCSLCPADNNRASHGERLLAVLGGAVGIMAVIAISRHVLDQQGAAMIVGSMGASAVLLFAAPHSALSQPWAVIGGHLVGAFIGVSCALYLPNPLLAAPLAVGLSIAVMYYLRCLHPPAGATALVAVLGGEAVRELGYAFIFTPVLENVLILLAVAVLFNLPFAWRRYPAYFSQRHPADEHNTHNACLSHEDLVYAVSQLDSFIDVSEQDLQSIFQLAQEHARNPELGRRSIKSRETRRSALERAG